jgi:hypothetical protein
MAGEPSSPLIKVGGCKNRAFTMALNGLGWPERMIRSSRGVDRRRSAGCLYDRWLVGQRLAWRVGRHQTRLWRGVRERVGWIGFGVRRNGHDHFLELCSYRCYTRRTAMRRSCPSTPSHFAHQRRNAWSPNSNGASYESARRLGIERAKTNGVYKGRKPTVPVEQVRAMHKDGVGPSAIARELGISRMSVHRPLNGRPKRSTSLGLT